MRWTRSRLRDFILQLPEVEPGEHHGTPDLRVSGRIIASFPPGSGEVVLKTTPLSLDMLIRQADAPYHDRSGGRWMGIDLERAPLHQVAELAIEAYCLAAPAKLAARVRADPNPLASS